MASTQEARKYSTQDLSACRWIDENGQGGSSWDSNYALVDSTPTTGTLSVAIAQRLLLLGLIDGAYHTVADGDLVALSGIGKKQAMEAVRLGIAPLANLP